MNKEELKNKIAEILNVSTSERDLAFEMMLKKLSEILNFDEAINIPEVGIFSLKKEPLLREERGETAGISSKKNLVFLPDKKDSAAASKSMYLSFNLDNPSKDYLEFDENVFSISVGKPVVSATGIQSGTSNDDNPERMLATLEEKVQKLVANTEKISDYDIWNEFTSKGKNNENEDIIENDTAAADEDLKQMVSESVENEVMAELEPEHESNNQHEVNADSELLNENAAEVPSEKNDSEILEDENKLVDGSIKEEVIPEEEQSNAEDSESDDKKDEDINWDWGDELKEELEADTEKTIDESAETKEEVSQGITNPENEGNKSSELFESVDNANDTTEEEEKVESEDDTDVSSNDNLRGTKTVEYSPEDFEKEQPKESKIDLIKKKLGFGKTFWILVAVFVFIGIAGIYFLFFTGGSESADIKHDVVPDTLIHKRLKPTENNSIEKNTADNISKSKSEKIKEDSVLQKSGISKPEEIAQTKEKKAETKPVVNGSLYRSFPNEKQVSNLIFLQNGVYSVQVSSRRNKFRAEQYVKKLRNIGYEAFIVKTYLSQLKSTWYRVRIGFFKSEKEAMNFRIKNKF